MRGHTYPAGEALECHPRLQLLVLQGLRLALHRVPRLPLLAEPVPAAPNLLLQLPHCLLQLADQLALLSQFGFLFCDNLRGHTNHYCEEEGEQAWLHLPSIWSKCFLYFLGRVYRLTALPVLVAVSTWCFIENYWIE